ncbi:DUF2147 domain-containing protein [Marivita sp. S2033]|uniref:DUF2147 domain-containing protein n=1 Tax=Marivita sp. S2033 TaxID=3373187 RepID=UPI003982B1E6
MKLTTMVAGLAMIAGAAWADPVEGTWQTEVDEGNYAHVRMVPCGDMICGVIARSFNAQGEFKSPNTGKTLVINMVPQGNGKYEGKVWRPSNDKIYMGKMQVNGNSLDLSGCVAGGLLCSKQTWSRVN